MEAGHGRHEHDKPATGAVAVGTPVIYHSEYGDVPGVVADYVEGKDGGDYLLGGFWNKAAKEGAGQGPVFSLWSVVGAEKGAFTAS